jgi:hypothetical protein
LIVLGHSEVLLFAWALHKFYSVRRRHSAMAAAVSATAMSRGCRMDHEMARLFSLGSCEIDHYSAT